MSDYLHGHGTLSTPQDRRADPQQILNDAAGYVFPVDGWQRLRRWLIIGSESGSYYASARSATEKNVDALRACLAEDGPRAVSLIVEVSRGGLAPSNDEALYALAFAISHGDEATRSAAAEALPRVARTGTHLFQFVAYARLHRGWGPALRWAVGNWYVSQSPADLAYQAIKYQQRGGISHSDLLRLSHPKAPTVEHELVFGFISGNAGHTQTFDEAGRLDRAVSPFVLADPGSAVPGAALALLEGARLAQVAETPAATAELARGYRLPREALVSEHLTDPVVWRALIEADMPITALVRNLANMTRYGVLDNSDYRDRVTEALVNPAKLRAGRVHPIALLVALRTYKSGHGFRGQSVWSPIPDVVDALDEAFYLAFENVEPTGKKMLLAVDVSGSMQTNAGVSQSPLKAGEAAAAMALVTLHAEPDVTIVGFTTRVYDVPFSRRQRLDDAIAQTHWRGEGTDCASPLTWALDRGLEFDAAVLYTDNQTWAGRTRHVHQAVTQLRSRRLGFRAVAVGMVANEFSVLDPTDAGSLNVAGFDSSAPALISAFVAGQL